MEDLERAKSKYDKECSDETAEIKREKRRLNDLLTLREEEIEKLKEGDKVKSKLVQERDGVIVEMERKIKHMEKKYEKQI